MNSPRIAAGFLLTVAALAFGLGLAAQEPEARLLERRYKIDYNPLTYPQKTPQEALKSVVRALDNGAHEYLLAHLVDPKFVETRVAEYFTVLYPKDLLRKEDEAFALVEDAKLRLRLQIERDHRLLDRQVLAFGRFVQETRKHFSEDPVLVRELQQMSRGGEWDADDTKGACSLKAVTSRKAFFRIVEGRWFMEERQQ